jgi:amidase
MQIVDLSAVALSTAIHRRDISCSEVMRSYLARIHVVNPRFNAIVSLRPDDELMREAQSKDDLLASGQSQGWMHGFPQAPKDLTATAGLATVMGFRGLRNNVPTQDSVVAARMRAAGSIFIGKTNTPEFGLGSHTYNSVFGATGNAFDTTKSAGGSSGGSAVALAQRLLPVADGSDMMGSLRNPAAWNAVYGMRPSMGRIPYGTQAGTGLLGDVFFQQLGIEGPMGRSIEDLAHLFAVQVGSDPRAPLSRQPGHDFTAGLNRDVKGKRLGWLGDMRGHLALAPALVQGYEQSLTHFEGLGCFVELAHVNIDLESVWRAWLTLRGMTVGGNLSVFAQQAHLRQLLKPEAVWEYEQAQQYTALDVYKASAVRSALYAALLTLFETVDYIVLPAAQCMPFDSQTHWPTSISGRSMDTYHRWMECTIYATLAGLPALAVPAGLIEGLPFGLQIIGRPNAESELLQLGWAWQQVASKHAPETLL